MEIERVNTYRDPRFSQTVLDQHGAFLLDGRFPCEVEITGPDTAVVRWDGAAGDPAGWLDELTGTFRFYAEHICKFYDVGGTLLREFPPVERSWLPLEDIQPSQFYVDEDKVRAVRRFLRAPEDVVIPVVREAGRFVSCDGHTRLYAAHQLGFSRVLTFEPDLEGDYIFAFAREARKRGVDSPAQLQPLPHKEYVEKWDRFCEGFFAQESGDG